MTALPPLRLPRCLLEPCRRSLPPPDDDGLVTVRLEHREGRWTDLRGCPGPVPDAPLALTPPVEPHAHLDKAYSFAAFPNRGGTIAGALAANRREAEQRSAEDVLDRGERALERGWRHGLRAIRSHIDSLGPAAEASWEALGALRRRWAGRVDLQLVALVPVGHWATEAGARLAARVAAAGGLLGGVLGNPYPATAEDATALLALLGLAESQGCGVDLHIDENDREPAGLRLLTRLLRRHQLRPPITCSHASGMALLSERPCRRLAEEMAAAGVGVVALPATNLWLLGRRPGRTPLLRPQAPVRELQEAGVTVAVGGDNVQDPWFPGGDFDPLALLRFAVTASQLEPWSRLGLAPFTTAAARLLALPWDGVVRLGAPADLVVLDTTGWPGMLAREPRRRVLRGGRWLPPPAWDAPLFPFADEAG